MSAADPSSDASSAQPDASSEDFEALLAAQKKRRWVAILVGGGLVAVVIGAAALWIATRPDPLCDPEGVDTFLSERRLPASVVGEVCSLPGPLETALRDMQAAPPEWRGMLVMKAAAETPSLIVDVCPNGLSAAADAGRHTKWEATGAFLEQCDISETGISEQTAREATIEQLLLALMVWSAIHETDGDHAVPIAHRILEGHL